MRRAGAVFSVGLTVAGVLAGFVAWQLASLGGWDAAALTFLVTVWPIVVRADGSHTEHLAMGGTRRVAQPLWCCPEPASGAYVVYPVWTDGRNPPGRPAGGQS